MESDKYREIIHQIVIPKTLSPEEQLLRYAPLSNFLQNKTPEYLYRFRQCNENSISAFDQDQIWFSPGSVMNDDFDALLFLDKEEILQNLTQFFGTFHDYILKIKSNDEILDTIPDSLPDSVQQIALSIFKNMDDANIATFTTQALNFILQQLNDSYSEILHIVQQTIKFACFSETIDSAAMWGYYADSGKGFALAYDFRNQNYTDCTFCSKNRTCSSIQKAQLYRVIYDDKPFNATKYAEWLLLGKTLFNITNNAQLFNFIPCPDLFMSTKILLHKAPSWAHEKEWRLVYTCGTTTDPSAKYVCVKKRPTALYLGRKISLINEKILRHIAAEKNIPVYKMTIPKDSATYRLIPQ